MSHRSIRALVCCILMASILGGLVPPVATTAVSAPPTIDAFQMLDWLAAVNAPTTSRADALTPDLTAADTLSARSPWQRAPGRTGWSLDDLSPGQHQTNPSQTSLFDLTQSGLSGPSSLPRTLPNPHQQLAISPATSPIQRNQQPSRANRLPVIQMVPEAPASPSLWAKAKQVRLYLPLVQQSFYPPVTVIVEPNAAAALVSSDGVIRVALPAGSVTSSTVITLRRLPATTAVQGAAIDRFFVLTAMAVDGAPVTRFARPITVSIAYPITALPERSLGVFRQTTGSSWQQLATQIDVSANTATVIIDRAATFGLLPPPSDNIWQVGHIVWLCQGAPLFAAPSEEATIHTIVPNDYWEVLIIGGPFTPDGTEWWHIDRNGAGDPSGGQGWTRRVPSEGCADPGGGNDGLGMLPYSAALRALLRLLGTGPVNVRVGGDPVNTANGNFIYQATDLAVPGVAGLDLILERVFNSRDPRDGVFGTAWSSMIDTSLRLANDGSVDVRKPDGGGAFFERSGDGYEPGFAETADTLAMQDGELVLTTPDQRQYHFPMVADPSTVLTATGGFVYLTKITDRNGNSIQFARDAAQHVTAITDSAGRTYGVSYAGNHIERITDPLGREFVYTYTGDDLASASEGNGGVTAYTYDQHRIAAITDPAGITYLQNQYDGDGRVLGQIGSTRTTASFTYADGQTIFHDYLGNPTTDTYNEDDQLIATTNALNHTIAYTYDAVTGRVRTTTDRRGNDWITEYDTHGNLLQTIDPLGHSVSSTYNATNDRTSITDTGGRGDTQRTTIYEYDDRGNLTAIRFADATSITMTYDGRGQMVTLTDANGGTTIFAYDGDGNRILQTDPMGFATDFGYDGVGRVVSITDANSHRTAITYDGNDNVTRVTDPLEQPTILTYDANDNLTEMIDRADGVWTYAYDSDLNLATQTDPQGHATTHTYDPLNHRTSTTDARQHTTLFRYDAIYRLHEIEDALHSVTTRAYDPNDNLISETDALGYPTTYQYDEANRRTATIDALDSSTTEAYDTVNRRVGLTNARGAVTRFFYDVRDRLYRRIDALEGRWEYAYDGNGNLLNATDPNGHVTTYAYDPDNRLMSHTDPGGHGAAYGYDPVGNLTDVTNPRGFVTSYAYDPNDTLITVTDALKGVTTMAYDPEERLVAVTDANRHTTRFSYDRDGLMITLTEAGGQVSRFGYDPTHNVTTFTNAKGNRWHYVYDELNRRTSETDPLAHTTLFSYDAVSQLTHRTDANGIITRSEFDPVRRLSAVTQNDQPEQSGDHQTNVTTRYEYDPVANLTTIIYPNSEHSYFEYDLLDRMIRETDQLGRIWGHRFDPVGNEVERIDANNQRTRYAYDADDLLTLIDYDLQHDVRFAYDENHNQTRLDDALGVTANGYDALDRLTSSTNHLGQRVQSAYDPVGNRIALTYPDGRVVRSAYDPTNFVSQVVDPDGWTFNVTRDLTHNVVVVQNPNETTAEYTIDAAERLTAVRNLTAANPHEVISSFAYQLDPVGNRLNSAQAYRWRKPTALTETYRYDPLYRLTRSSDSEGHFTEYTYDANGNRLRRTTNDDPTLRRAIDEETTTYAYDAADELITTVREVAPRGNADRAAQTGQALRAYVHEVRAQRGQHLPAETADALAAEADGLIAALDESPAPNPPAVAQAIADLRDDTATASDHEGTVQSLQAKLDQADAANDRRGGELFVSLYSYDENGNRVRRDTPDATTGNERDWFRSEYFYDVENRLVHEQDFRSPGGETWLPGDESFLIYDGYGRLFRRQHDQHIGGGGDQHWTDYVYDGLEPIVEYRDPSPQYTNYYRGLGHILSQHDYKSQQSPQGTLYYYHYDGLDSVSALTKHQGQSVHNYRYHDSGIILDINGHAADASNFTDPHNHYAYTGHEWDEYLELHHTYAREYDAFTGTWLQRDPYRGRLADPMTLHRYAYVGNNPINFGDRYGYQEESYVTKDDGWIASAGDFIKEVVNGLMNIGKSSESAPCDSMEGLRNTSCNLPDPTPDPRRPDSSNYINQADVAKCAKELAPELAQIAATSTVDINEAINDIDVCRPFITGTLTYWSDDLDSYMAINYPQFTRKAIMDRIKQEKDRYSKK